jgi:cell fate (sporulation/competence/biofilm development) regulator YmcA (YheA/YmcA/DUF963 family)
MLSKDRLIAEIRDNPYIKEYKRLEKTLNEDATLKKEIIHLQQLQQEMVNLKAAEKHKALQIAEKEYWDKRKRLEKNPIISNYLTLQTEINNLFKTIKEILEEALII